MRLSMLCLTTPKLGCILIECVKIALMTPILTGEVETMLEEKHIDLTLLHSQPLDQPYVAHRLQTVGHVRETLVRIVV